MLRILQLATVGYVIWDIVSQKSYLYREVTSVAAIPFVLKSNAVVYREVQDALGFHARLLHLTGASLAAIAESRHQLPDRHSGRAGI